MAKLKGPLFSLGASGQLAKTLVFGAWKGLNTVRSYVVPANPKSAAQLIQRAFMTAIVDLIHNSQAAITNPWTSADKSAYARAGSLHTTPRTWFNEATKICLDAAVDEQTYAILRAGLATYNGGVSAIFFLAAEGFAAKQGIVKYGVSKTSMLSSVNGDVATGVMTATLTGLVLNTFYYIQWQADPIALTNVVKSGIYTYLHQA